jgi:hypothetical protein
MKNEKNKLATLSRCQSNPYTAAPEDFQVIRDDDEIFHGQQNDKLQKQADAECNRRPTKRRPATEPSDAAPSKSGRL